MLFFAVVTGSWFMEEDPPIVRSDAKGYYGYLRAVLINHDLGHEEPDPAYIHQTPDGTLNKYFAGEAVLLLPFFLMAHGWAHVSGDVTDGLSPPYMRAVGIAALCYALVGLLAFRAVMRRSGVNEPAATATILVLGSGTQLVQYASMQPGWSHVYSFCMIALFLLGTMRLAENVAVGRAIAWGLALGLVILLRPVNGLVLLAVPIVLGKDTRAFATVLVRRRGLLVLAVLASASVVAIQCALWYMQTGHPVAYGYKGEGFHWDRPEVRQVLIGFRRGLFLWTPVFLPAALSALVLFRLDRSRALWTGLYWAVNTYIISAWWIWYYGSGWGARVFVDHYPVLFIPLALVLSYFWEARRALWRVTIGALAVASLFTMMQFYQYNNGLLDTEGMDARKYRYAFMRFDDAHRDRLGGMYRVPPYNPEGLDTLMHEKWDTEGTWSHWDARRIRMDGAPSPTHAAACDLVDGFGPAFTLKAGEFPAGRELYLAIGFERYVEHADDTRGVLCVTVLEDTAGTQSYYKTFPMEPLPPHGDRAWEHVEYRIPYPAASGAEDLKFYFWNKESRGRFRLDDLDVTVMVVRPY